MILLSPPAPQLLAQVKVISVALTLVVELLKPVLL